MQVAAGANEEFHEQKGGWLATDGLLLSQAAYWSRVTSVVSMQKPSGMPRMVAHDPPAHAAHGVQTVSVVGVHATLGYLFDGQVEQAVQTVSVVPPQAALWYWPAPQVAQVLQTVSVVAVQTDRKSTRLNSSHRCISYA